MNSFTLSIVSIAEHRARREQMRALCESDPAECQARRDAMRAKREACREDPGACPRRHHERSAN